MNTVFVVENSAYQFINAPDEIKMNWIREKLKVEKFKSINVSNNLSIVQTSKNEKNVTYKVKIDDFQANINGDFMLLKRIKNLFLPLDEIQENYIIDQLKISRIHQPTENII